MGRIYVPTVGPTDWRRLLGDPEKHWRAGYSAMSLASCWEAASGLPPEIAELFEPIGPAPELLICIPEHKVPLPGASRGESQNDLFALIRAGDTTIATTIEGKVDEPFDRQMVDWLRGASPGKLARLKFLCDLLGLPERLPDNLHYQLLHRAAAAIIEAKRFKTDAAAMIVHSFSPVRRWFDAFEFFGEQFGVKLEHGRLMRVPALDNPPLLIGWAIGDRQFLQPLP